MRTLAAVPLIDRSKLEKLWTFMLSWLNRWEIWEVKAEFEDLAFQYLKVDRKLKLK